MRPTSPNPTPGGFSVDKDTIEICGDHYIAILDNDPRVSCIVALVPFNTTDGDHDHAPANAALFAAAKDLLVAMENIIECADDPDNASDSSLVWAIDWEAARSAIKKAKTIKQTIAQ